MPPSETSPEPPLLVVMLGGMDGGRLESLMREALEASAFDAVEVALETGRFRGAVLLTDAPPHLEPPSGLEVDVDEGAFQYGERLAAAVATREAEALVYLGGGSSPLLGPAEFEALAGGIEATPDAAPRMVTNNFYSADLFALRPASTLARLDPPPASDNSVPRRLRESCGVAVKELPRSLATQLNLDTPVDLAALALSGRGGPRLRAVLDAADLSLERLAASSRVFTDRTAEVLVAGRVASRAWQYLERDTACRVRLLSEERGMSAAGRESGPATAGASGGGAARSLLGMLIASEGPQRFFTERLPELCNAAFIDLRPALIQLGLTPSRADRFAADLGLADEIEDAGLRALVEAANASPVPVALGGHSLVAGALMLLNDWAWEQVDGVRRPGGTAV